VIGFDYNLGKWGLPEGLMKWLGTNSRGFMIHDIPTIAIDLGPNGAYWASDKNSCAWGNLPAALDKTVNQSRNPKGGWKPGERPIMVSLGYGGSYIMINEGRGGRWDLKGQNVELNTFLTDAESFSDIAVCHSCFFLAK
jgi:hypothetical protein